MGVAVVFAVVGFGFFLIGLLIGRSKIFLPGEAGFREGLWGFSWFAMFMSVTIFVGREFAAAPAALDKSSVIQLAWVSLAVALILVSFVRVRLWLGFASAPIVLFLAYGVIGFASSIFSPQPMFSLYKSGLVVIDAILAAGMLSLALKYRNTNLVNFSLGLIVLALGGALFGAILWPTEAFQPKPGVFGTMLYGTLPKLHPNELGMWAGIVTVVSLVRWYVATRLRGKWCWALMSIAAAVVVLLAQSRTSIAAILVSLTIIVPYLAKSRAQAIFGSILVALIAVGVLGMIAVIYGEGILFGGVVNYLERGQGEGGLATFHDRMWAWMNIGWPLFVESPIVGHGFDAGVRFGSDVTIGHLHNSYFQVLANSGLLGFLPWVAALIIGSIGLMRHAWLCRSAALAERVCALIPLLILIGLLARTWTGSVLVSHAWSTMMFLALIINLYVERKKRQL